MKDYDYYTVDEILKALESNTDEVLTRTVILSKHILSRSMNMKKQATFKTSRMTTLLILVGVFCSTTSTMMM